MNKVLLVGRLTKDPEVKATTSQVKVCNFTIAVDRKFKDNNGNKQADFINCVAWRQTAEFIGKYFTRGQRIGIVGCIQTRTYDDNNGQRHYITEVLAEDVEFVDSAAGGANNGRQPTDNGYQQQQQQARPQYSAQPVQTPQESNPVQMAEPVQQIQAQPAQGSVAEAAPTAPMTSIDPNQAPMPEGEFNPGESGEDLPFEI
ncbi:MAG: single-stranded DNA-binding protein [Clostridiales bacterium]|nr:single-stranded DNA-binding protein [Clostridiales bacterium]